MKTIFLVGGTMGVGKNAVCQKMNYLLNNSVFLDGGLVLACRSVSSDGRNKKYGYG